MHAELLLRTQVVVVCHEKHFLVKQYKAHVNLSTKHAQKGRSKETPQRRCLPPLPETDCSLIGHRLPKQDLQLVLSGGLLLLHELGVALGDAPSGGSGHGGAVGAAGRRRELLPVVSPSPDGEEVNKYTQ